MASVDRLSGLTESLRCHILSFLSTKDSVSTSILSREWRYLWTKVPTLDFQDDDKESPLVPEGGASFSNVVHRFLQWNRVPLNTFCMGFMYRYTEDMDITQYEIETWIFTAIEREVKTLVLTLDKYKFLPRSLFISETLVNLRLYEVDIGTAWPRQVSLPCLRKLLLSMVYYRRDETLPQLLSGCPVLEKLVIEGIILGDLVCWIVSSPTIKWLEVDFCSFDGQYRLEIDAPALGYLKINNSCPLPLAGMTFSASTIKFGNLIELELFTRMGFISKFLENADNLQVLTILQVRNRHCWKEPQQMPTCLSHLRTISIDEFGCAEHQFEMIRYLLKNARILKKMKIHFYGDFYGGVSKETRSSAIQRISQFERGSEACKIAFSCPSWLSI